MFKLKGPILATVSCDEVSQEVLRHADALARFYDVKLCICHILPEKCAGEPLFPYRYRGDALKVSADLEDSLLQTIHTITSREPTQVSIVIERGTTHSAILRAAERVGAGAIIVGGESKQDSMPVWGGIAEQVTRHTDCPVWLVRPSPDGRVLAATDFSDPALVAMAAGAAEALRLHADLAITHAIEVLPVMLPAVKGVAYSVLLMDAAAHLRQASQRKLDDCVRRFDAKGGGLLSEGPAAPAILRAAKELPTQLIVVGKHGKRGGNHLTLGRVAEAIIRASPCSVLIARIAEHGQ